jgi:NAD-dependent deacetylase
MVQEFYNMRRKSVLEALPNEAHKILARLDDIFKISIITQNVDDLHERAGSRNVLHLHGEILFSRSSINEKLTYPISGWELKMGEMCELGSQLRPHIVWFGEAVPLIEKAVDIASRADIFLIVGTSLQVYPAAGLVRHVGLNVPVYLIDPKPIEVYNPNLIEIRKVASEGMKEFEKLFRDC